MGTSVADKPTLVRQVTERLDNQGREREVFDTGALFITGFDNENNRTYLQGFSPAPMAHSRLKPKVLNSMGRIG